MEVSDCGTMNGEGGQAFSEGEGAGARQMRGEKGLSRQWDAALYMQAEEGVGCLQPWK